MPTEKQAIAEALQSLDKANDKLWTDDGSPLVGEVQRVCNDKTITRAQINEALPGFSRFDAPEAGATEPASEVTAAAPSPDAPFDDRIEPEVNGPGAPLTDDEVRAILTRRIRDAESALTAARNATSEARMEERRCEQRLDRAHKDHQRHFPPITAAENIKQHLAAQQELLRQRVEGTGTNGRSQVDQAMERANKRGWTRPVHNGTVARSAA